MALAAIIHEGELTLLKPLAALAALALAAYASIAPAAAQAQKVDPAAAG